MPQPRVWDGKEVSVQIAPQIQGRRHIAIGLTDEAARHLVHTLRRLEQTYVDTMPGAVELRSALDYVLVADPASVAAHRRMEAGKGMTPDGGYREPEALPFTPPWVEIRRRGHESLAADGD
jgi:hypothetical protein